MEGSPTRRLFAWALSRLVLPHALGGVPRRCFPSSLSSPRGSGTERCSLCAGSLGPRTSHRRVPMPGHSNVCSERGVPPLSFATREASWADRTRAGLCTPWLRDATDFQRLTRLPFLRQLLPLGYTHDSPVHEQADREDNEHGTAQPQCCDQPIRLGPDWSQRQAIRINESAPALVLPPRSACAKCGLGLWPASIAPVPRA